MTDLLDRAVRKVRALPSEVQDELALVLLRLVGDDQPLVELTPEEDASFQRSFEQAERGEFATDEQIRAIWAKHGL